jgi:hypothetical protein
VSCAHEEFNARVAVNRLVDGDAIDFNADVTITCRQCGAPFKFLGLEQGLNLDGAAVSPDGTEARLAISADGLPSLAGGCRGFRVTGAKVPT